MTVAVGAIGALSNAAAGAGWVASSWRRSTHVTASTASAPAKTILDLATTADAASVGRALDEARFRNLLTDRDLQRLRERTRGRAWPDQGLVVEIDGYASHGRHATFERDRRRGADLDATGIKVRRFTWSQITDHRLWLAARLGAAIARRPPARGASSRRSAEAQTSSRKTISVESERRGPSLVIRV